MSAALDDRLLHGALLALHDEPAPDLTGRIVAAWESGVRPSTAPRSPRARPRTEHREAAQVPARALRSTRRLRLALAAGVTLLVGGAAAVWFLAEGRARRARLALASSEIALPVLRGESAGPELAQSFRAGDVLALRPGQRARLALASGAEVALGPAAVLGLRTGALELLRGELELGAAPAGLELDPGFLRARAGPAADVTARLVYPKDARAPAEIGDAQALDLLRQDARGARELRLHVRAGELVVEHAGGRETLPAGTRRLYWPRLEPLAAADEAARAKLELLLRDLFDVPRPGRMPAPDSERSVNRSLAFFLADHTDLWPAVHAQCAQLARADKLPPAALPRLCVFALTEPTGEGFALGRELWMLRPEHFGELELAAFAERGAFEFQRECRALLAEGTRPALFPAAWAARAGEPGALARVLDACLAAPAPKDDWSYTSLAFGAAVLEAHEERGGADRVLDRLELVLREELERADLESAARGCEFVGELLARARTGLPPLASALLTGEIYGNPDERGQAPAPAQLAREPLARERGAIEAAWARLRAR